MKALSTAIHRARIGILAVFLLGVAACEPTGPVIDRVQVTGAVVDGGSGSTLEYAVVRIVNLEPPAVAQTGPEGQYTFTVEIGGPQDLLIVATKEGYQADTTEVVAVPNEDLAVPDLRLVPLEDGGSATPSTRTGPKSIVLYAVSDESILVKESGGQETADITFEVQDSTGLPLDLNSGVNVTFKFGAAPGGGETLFPTVVKTNANGRATTSLHSGTVAGVVQVVAEVDHNGTIIRSKPASIAIHGGLPDAGHFGVGVTQFNMPFVKLGYSNRVTAIAGDKYGNVATPGTSVYFSTTGGIIEGSATTDLRGAAAVDLISNNPYPTHPDYGPGYAVVTAYTANENNQTISTSALVLMSGNATISGVSPTSFNIANGNAQTFQFTVSDQYGNPLSAGTSIVVTASEGVTLAGNTSVTLDDALFGGAGITDFSFTAADADAETIAAASVTITIRVTGPNGTAQATISGTVN